MAVKVLRLRRLDTCVVCSTDLAVGTEASWDASAKTVTCLACVAPPTSGSDLLDPGRAGRSAHAEYARRSDRERARKVAAVEHDAEWRASAVAQRPILGRVATALTPKPIIAPESQATGAWNKGAAGERRVGEILDSCSAVRPLHDRRIPGSKANIDHLVVAPTGVYVIDAKKYDGRVESRDRGTWLRSDVRLYVAGRDRTKLVRGVAWQVDRVRAALSDSGLTVEIHGVLCFVDSEWPIMFRRPLHVERVTVVWPTALPPIVGASGPLSGAQVDDIARRVAATFRSA